MRALLEATLAAAVSVLCAAWVLRLWRADLGVPLRYGPVDDTKFYLMLVKGLVEHGSYLSNPSLGAPFIQHLNDYPQGADNLNLLIVRGLAVFSSNPAVVLNIFFLLTFATASFTAHLVLRSQGINSLVAGVVAVLFSLLAYHFFRGESHLMLSAYYGVPLSAYLFLSLLADVPLFRRRPAARRRASAWLSGRSLSTVALCVVIGSDNLYYAVFALVLILAGVLITLILRRGRTALSGTVVAGLIVLTLTVNLAPTLTYRASHGVNHALSRSAVADETSNEAFSLRLANLVLPAPGNTLSPLNGLATSYDHAIAPGYCEACYASLGSVGTVGFVWLAVCALAALLGAGAWYGARHTFRHAAAGVLIAIAVGSAGGLSSLIEFSLTPDIRGWNRISVPIAFLSLLAGGLLLDSLRESLLRRGGPALAGVLLAAVLIFGVVDQTGGASPASYGAGQREYRSDGTFVAEIQDRLPRNASVFQLPYVPFPEGYPTTPVSDAVATYATKYESLRGYLHSSTLRWSYGAMKGRPADWSARLAGLPLGRLVARVTAAGFDGIWVDPAGFEPQTAQRVLDGLTSLLGAPLLSPARDLEFFELRSLPPPLEHPSPAVRSALAVVPGLTGPPARR